MPIIGVKRSSNSQEHQTLNKRPTPTPGLWGRFVNLLSSVMSRDETATGSHGDGTKGTIATRRDILISVPQARVLHTPVLSELERGSNRKFDILSVTTPTLRPSRTPLFTPVLLNNKSRQHVAKTPRSHKIAVMSSNSSSLRSDILSGSPPSIMPTSLQRSKDHQGVISKPSGPVSRVISSRSISTESRMEAKPMLTKRVSSSTASKDQVILTSMSEVSLPVRQLWNSSTSQRSDSKHLISSVPLSITNVQSTLPTTDHESNVDQVSKKRSHTNHNGMTHHLGNKSSDKLEEWQKWFTEFKYSYHSNRRDITAQIEAAEKYAKLQNNQRQQLCNQRVDQLRRRFDSGLSLDELLASPDQEEQTVEIRLQHDDAEELQIRQALGSGAPDEELSHAFRIRLKRRDISTLNHLQWLNDEVVNFYMSMIAECCPDVHTYSSFFYSKLMSAGYSGVRRWTKKVDVFSKRLLLVPVHLGMHWCLAAIDFTSKQISYYDSMMGRNPTCLDGLRQYLTQEAQDKKSVSFDLTGWKYTCHQDIPEQLNSSDCGVFMCMWHHCYTIVC
ncbi:sentrin-specific protease 1-like isoform X2 [Dysidea avara]|uniref:sentrin-specific protease 1-like isoform X2 n=1 Tax=Dysidea avara TaxID=196820 RepID=UPI003319438A